MGDYIPQNGAHRGHNIQDTTGGHDVPASLTSDAIGVTPTANPEPADAPHDIVADAIEPITPSDSPSDGGSRIVGQFDFPDGEVADDYHDGDDAYDGRPSLLHERCRELARLITRAPESLEGCESGLEGNEVIVRNAELFAEKLTCLTRLLYDADYRSDPLGLLVASWGLQWLIARSRVELATMLENALACVPMGGFDNGPDTIGARLSFQWWDRGTAPTPQAGNDKAEGAAV